MIIAVYFPFKQLERRNLKKNQGFNGIRTCDLRDTGAMLYFRVQLVEHRTGIAEVTGSNPVEALIFFRLLLSSCLNCGKIYCHDHSSLSSTTAVPFIYVLFRIYITSLAFFVRKISNKRR